MVGPTGVMQIAAHVSQRDKSRLIRGYELRGWRVVSEEEFRAEMEHRSQADDRG